MCKLGYICGPGSYDEEGRTVTSSSPNPCPEGFYQPGAPETRYECAVPCPPGMYCVEATGVAVICPPGRVCPGGTSYLCPEGMWCKNPGMTSPGPLCPPGHMCPEGSVLPTLCDEGFACPAPGGVVQEACPPGGLCDRAGLAVPSLCPAGSYCPGGSAQAAEPPVPCESGEYCPAGSVAQRPCAAGSYCPTPAEEHPCPAGSWCAAGSVEPTPCPSGLLEFGLYCPEGGGDPPAPCPAGSWCPTPAVRVPCADGTLCPPGSAVEGAACPAGHFCPGAAAQYVCHAGAKPCAAGQGHQVFCNLVVDDRVYCIEGTSGQNHEEVAAPPVPPTSLNNYSLREAVEICLSVEPVEGLCKGSPEMGWLSSLDLSEWDVSRVTDMDGLFNFPGAKAFNGDLSRWDLGAVTTAVGMFEGAVAYTGVDVSRGLEAH